MASNKDSRQIAREAKSLGMQVKRLKNGHYRITSRAGESMDIPFSPGSAGRVSQMLRDWNKFRKEQHV